MNSFHMKPFTGKPHIDVEVPGSKSITNRALLLAALANGKSVLSGVLFSDDTRVFMDALIALGYKVWICEDEHTVTIQGRDIMLPRDKVEIYVGSAGTAARFLTAMLALSGKEYTITASPQMSKRPMRPLLEALEQSGAHFTYYGEPYTFPLKTNWRSELYPSDIYLDIDESSQFLSAILLNKVFYVEDTYIHLTGKRDARSYVEITRKMMREFGNDVKQISKDTYDLGLECMYIPNDYHIEPDVSAACYFYGMAAINGGTARVANVHLDSMQGDIKFLYVLQNMGCSVEDTKKGVVVTGPAPGELKGVSVDMSDFSDQTMTLAVVAAFANSPTQISNVGHIRHQESDRIHGTVTDLKKMGVDCEETKDGLIIRPGDLSSYAKDPVEIDTYEDHRMAMAFAMAGTRIPGVTIKDPQCCKKTFEDYFKVLTELDLRLN